MYPSLEEVKLIASQGEYRRIPVCRELYADRFTPVEVMRTLRAASKHCYLLESAENDQKWGRYSMLGYEPVLELSCLDGRVRILLRSDPNGGGTDCSVHEGIFFKRRIYGSDASG